MTSGTFTTWPISSITIPEDRQRKEFVEIEALAESISRLGLINPLTITESGTLVAGERRLLAVKSLGWTTVPVQLASDVSPKMLRAIELEENTRRKDLTWQEEAIAIFEYDRDRKAEVEGWSTADTAAALGNEVRIIQAKLSVAKEVLSGNASVAEAPKLSTAIGLVTRKNERAAASKDAALAAIIYDTPGATFSSVAAFEPVKVGDFNDFARTYEGQPFNLVHCDFPFGINANKMQQGYSVGEHGGYEDSPELYFNLLDIFVQQHDRFIADSAHLVFWFSMKYYSETLTMLRRTRFIVDDFPFIWLKDVGLLPDPNRGPRRVYETAFFGRAGDRKIVRAVNNAVQLPRGSDHIHMSVKPASVLEHFFRMLVDSSTTLFDPTAGGGTALQAALALGARSATGLEINPEFAQRANEALQKQRVELLKKEAKDEAG